MGCKQAVVSGHEQVGLGHPELPGLVVLTPGCAAALRRQQWHLTEHFVQTKLPTFILGVPASLDVSAASVPRSDMDGQEEVPHNVEETDVWCGEMQRVEAAAGLLGLPAGAPDPAPEPAADPAPEPAADPAPEPAADPAQAWPAAFSELQKLQKEILAVYTTPGYGKNTLIGDVRSIIDDYGFTNRGRSWERGSLRLYPPEHFPQSQEGCIRSFNGLKTYLDSALAEASPSHPRG